MPYTFVTLVVGALSLLILYLLKVYTYWKRQGIPTAKGIIPFLGHALRILTGKENYLILSSKLYEDYKGHSMVGFYKFTDPVLLIRDPKLMDTILRANFSSFRDNAGGPTPEVEPLLSTNPVFCNGDAWSSERKRLISAFSSTRLKMLFAVISGVCTKCQDFLDRQLKSSGKYEVELTCLISKFMHEVMAGAAFGIEGHCFHDEPHPLAFDRFGDEYFRPSAIASVKRNIVMYLFKLNSIVRFGIVPKKLEKFLSNLIDECLEARKNDTTPRNDFLQVMADLEKTNQEKQRRDLLVAHMAALYTDAIETATVTLGWIGYQLATHKDVQERLRAEVQSTIAKHGGKLTYEALKEMKYMDQVINESQRCVTNFSTLNKFCTSEFELEGSDGLRCRLKPGMEVTIPARALHRDPEHWPDAEVFDPDRFSEDRKNDIKKMTFLPFGEGPRICVGIRFALVQIKTFLAGLLNNYRLELSPKTQLPLQLSQAHITVGAEGGLWVHISKL